MRRWMVPLVVLFGLVLVGGAGWWTWQAGWIPLGRPEPVVTQPAEPVVQAPPATPARSLFPTANQVAGFDLDDGTRSTELLLPEGERLVQTYNGVPYVTWFFTADGVLRKDPRGNAPLRYLPAELKDGLAWKQAVSSGHVWFRLTKLTKCEPAGIPAAECWQLQVLSGKELTTFTFASGMGAVGAVSENWGAPRESFTKSLRSFAAVTVSEQQRLDLLAKGLKLDKLSPATVVEPATVAEFEAAVGAPWSSPR